MQRIAINGTPQMALGELMDALERLPLRYESGGKSHLKRVFFDFALTFPARLVSYRGSYSELAIAPGIDTYKAPAGGNFLLMLLDALAPGRTFGGWKGGEYQMTRDTPLWVAQDGENARTAVVGVRDDGCEIIIDTAWCEF